MKLFLISLIVSFLSLSVTAKDYSQYDNYLSKVFGTELKAQQAFTSIEVSDSLNDWLTEVDHILDTNKINSYNANFKFNIDQTGNIVAIELESLQERDFDKFKSFVEYLSALKFPSNSVDLTKFIFYLEGATLYLDRPKHAPARFAATITQETNINLDSLLDGEFYLVKPKYLDYSFLGQEILLKNNTGVFLKTYVTNKDESKISLNAFQAYDDNEVVHLNLDLMLEVQKNKNLAFKLVQSGLANGLKAGLVNSYTSYGIAPGVLALMGMAGTALIDHETENSFSLEKGEILQITKVEENK